MLKCSGGPNGGNGALEACGQPATVRMPYRSVYPQMPCCDLHAARWSGGREPRMADGYDAGGFHWHRIEGR
jgi:hypothetical protein